MTLRLDARVPVLLNPATRPGPDDVVLREVPATRDATAHFTAATPGHAAGCACCIPRGEAGRALAKLLQARARNEIPFFKRVVAMTVTDAGLADLKTALNSDPVASACFKFEKE